MTENEKHAQTLEEHLANYGDFYKPRWRETLRAATAALREIDALKAERDAAMHVLAPNMPESGLVDACRQVKQVAIAEADNSTRGEAEIDALRAQLAEAHEQTSALKAAMTEHVQPLSVQIESGVLVIRVGIKTLAHAVVWSEWAHSWDDETGDYIRRFAIEDHHQFAKDVMSMMRREEEDGSSLLSNFIDKAGEKAVDDGSLGLADGDHQIKYGEKSPLEKW